MADEHTKTNSLRTCKRTLKAGHRQYGATMYRVNDKIGRLTLTKKLGAGKFLAGCECNARRVVFAITLHQTTGCEGCMKLDRAYKKEIAAARAAVRREQEAMSARTETPKRRPSEGWMGSLEETLASLVFEEEGE